MSILPIRPELADIEPYGAPQLSGLIQLNVNENPFSPPAEVVAEIRDAVEAAAHGLNRYPDREFGELRQALADYLAAESAAPFLDATYLWAANGSNEALLQLFQAFGGPGRLALWSAPTYSMYPEYARDSNTQWLALESLELDDDGAPAAGALTDAIATLAPSIVVLASPNNPTGLRVPTSTIEAVLAATRSGERASAIVIVDEAYAEFRAPGTPSAVELLVAHPHLVVARTMSKAFALAGARVGYLAANPPLLDAVRTVRLPYHLSAITQAVALAALRHAPALQRQVAELRAERDEMLTFLRGLGLEAPCSDANFILFGRFGDRHAVWQALLERGVLIREVGPPGFLRVTMGTPKENAAFRAALVGALEGKE